MRQKINKLFLVWQTEKEEQWLSDMAARGLALVSVGFCRYEFEDCEPGEYTVRMEFLEHGLNHPESRKHIAFIEETGTEQVGSYGNWVYFRKKKAEGEFELYADLEGRLKQLSMVQVFLLPLFLINLGSGLYNVILHLSSVNFWVGVVNFMCSVFLLTGIAFLQVRKHRMKKAYELYEK